MQTFELTPKQAEYIRNANHRWNVACGAVRSGKSYCQVSYCIPSRLLERKDKRGLKVILGATRENIERNILQPMRDIYGDGVASSINSNNYAKILGEKVYCIGADNVRQVAKLRGSEIAYCAVDEATDVNEDVFAMLKSRLSLPWSCCDITTNPSSPNHWFKRFIDSRVDGVDVYLQEYTIYDNPFLPVDYVRNLEHEYAGTVWYDRYILGKWTLAEGLIYPMFLEALGEASLDFREAPAERYALSIDYGTQNAFAALLWAKRGMTWYAIDEYYYSGRLEGQMKTDADYLEDMEAFVATVTDAPILTIIDPSAASFIAALRRSGKFSVRHADNNVMDGIRDTAVCMKKGKIKVSPKLANWRNEVEGYIWDKREGEDRPVKVNDHLMDSMRYFVRTMRLVKRDGNSYKSPFGD